MRMNIGFIGLGTMGTVMCQRLIESGYELTVWNRTQEAASPILKRGAKWSDSPMNVAKVSDVVISMTSDDEASSTVICGSSGILEGAHPDMIIIDSASISPEIARSNAACAKEKALICLMLQFQAVLKLRLRGRLE